MGDNQAHRAEQLSTLFAATAEAHHRYEEETGQPDPDWPRWYASYLLDNGLGGQLGKELSVDEVRRLLAQADESHRANDPGTQWQDYYARYLLENT